MKGCSRGSIKLAATALFVLAADSSAQSYPEIRWWVDLDAPSFGSAAVADLDGDGLPEIVFGTYFNDETIHCLNGEDGTHLWTFPTGGCNDASPAISDVDSDGDLEVIVPCSSTQTVYCLDGATGTVEWSTNQGHCIDSPPAIADVDGDGDLEVLNGTFQGFVFCLDADSGHVQWQKGLGTDSAIESCPNVDDFDCDGQLEVVVAQWMGDCRVYCLNAVTGDVEWYSDAPGDYMYHGGSFADVDDDGLPEVAIGSYDGNVYLINGEDGSTEWSFPATAYACGPTSISDLDSDGLLEVFYATGSGVGTISSDGSGIWSIPTGGSVFRGAAVTDIDGDTIPDVLYGTSAGMLFARRGSAGELLWEIDLQAHYGDTYDIDHAPVTGDFDSDGSMDVFVVGGYGTSSAPEDNHGRAYMISAGPASGQVWPMFRHDLSRSGYYPWESTGVQEVPPALPEIGITCLPNPCSGSCTIQIEIQETTPASVILYDLAGRTVQMVRLLELESGVNSLSLDLEDLSTGTYLLRAESPSGCAVSRLVILE